MARFVPKRGDAIWLDFSPQRGHEQAGRRPALVVSATEYNRKVGLAVVCPITNQGKGLQFEVIIPAGHRVSGVVLSDHVKSLDWHQRNAAFICTLPNEVLEEALEKIAVLLGLDYGGSEDTA
jgi:mRNA interferase MazF